MQYNFPPEMIHVHVREDFDSAKDIKLSENGFHFVVTNPSAYEAIDLDALRAELLARVNHERGIALTNTQHLRALRRIDFEASTKDLHLAHRECLHQNGLNVIFYSRSYNTCLIQANGMYLNGHWVFAHVFEGMDYVPNPLLKEWRA